MDWLCWMEKAKLLTLNSFELSVKAVAFLGLSFEFYDLLELPYNFYTSFWSWNTNDAGEPLLAQSAHILFGEFKKFMIRNAAIIIKFSFNKNIIYMTNLKFKAIFRIKIMLYIFKY